MDVVANLDPEYSEGPNPEVVTGSEPEVDTSSEQKATPVGEPISVCSSLD